MYVFYSNGLIGGRGVLKRWNFGSAKPHNGILLCVLYVFTYTNPNTSPEVCFRTDMNFGGRVYDNSHFLILTHQVQTKTNSQKIETCIILSNLSPK